MTSDRDDLLIKIGFLFVILLITRIIDFSTDVVANIVNIFSSPITIGSSQFPASLVLIGVIAIVILGQKVNKQ